VTTTTTWDSPNCVTAYVYNNYNIVTTHRFSFYFLDTISSESKRGGERHGKREWHEQNTTRRAKIDETFTFIFGRHVCRFTFFDENVDIVMLCNCDLRTAEYVCNSCRPNNAYDSVPTCDDYNNIIISFLFRREKTRRI